MNRKVLMGLIAVGIMAGCSSGETEDSTLENPDGGEFGEAGAELEKTYAYQFEESTVEPAWFIYASNKCVDQSISDEFGKTFGGVFGYLGQNQVEPLGMPVARISPVEGTDSVCYEAGALVADSVGAPDGYVTEPMYSGKVVKVYHYGPYDNLVKVQPVLQEYLADNELKVNGEPWDEYVSDPALVKPDSILTVIYQPIK